MRNLRLIPNIHPPKAMVKANFAFDPTISAHLLGHRFDTHPQEQGISLGYIQILFEHNSSKTTESYTQVSIQEIGKIKNPLNDFYDMNSVALHPETGCIVKLQTDYKENKRHKGEYIH